jgi:hypothetical protein
MRGVLATTHEGRVMTPPLSRSRLTHLLVAGGVALASAWASPAAATELEDFQRAREAYLQHEYALAVELFEQMVGGPTPAIRDELLIQESRKYLAASYVFVGNREGAERQLETLLRARPDYELNRAAFPAEVIAVFDEVRARLRRASRTREEQLEQEEAERRERRRAATLQLIERAQRQEVEIAHDPLVAWAPFGAGQFQNGDSDLGVFFLVSEALTFVSAAVLLSIWIPLNEIQNQAWAGEPVVPPGRGVLQGLQGGWLAALGAFGVLAGAGILEAVINFVPSHTVRRTREVPTELLERLDLTLGPGYIHLSGSF